MITSKRGLEPDKILQGGYIRTESTDRVLGISYRPMGSPLFQVLVGVSALVSPSMGGARKFSLWTFSFSGKLTRREFSFFAT